MVSIQDILQLLLRPLVGAGVLLYILLWVLGRKADDIISSVAGLEDGVELGTHSLSITSLAPASGRQEPQLFVGCKLPLRNRTYFPLVVDHIEVRYELLGHRGRVDTKEKSRFTIRDIEPHSEREQQFECPIPWHIVRDAGDTSEPYLEGQIEAKLVPKVSVPLLTRVTDWQLSLSPLSLNVPFSAQIPTKEWHLSTETSHSEVISEAEWEQVSDQ